MYKLKRLVVAVAGAAALATIVPALGAAGQPVSREHSHFTFGPQPGNQCGIDGTWTGSGVENSKQDASGAFIGTGSSKAVFTATASGKSIEYHTTGVFKSDPTPVDNGDGTYSLVSTISGLFDLKIVNGPTLLRGGGTSTIVDIFDSATGDYITTTFSRPGNRQGPKGSPNPCDLIVPALT